MGSILRYVALAFASNPIFDEYHFGWDFQITGGQRIDMFGARKDDLPDIWEKLNDAGFESGHAYGKSLRTVKSCVGTTCKN